MTTVLNPYVVFPGNAREAMEFYESVFGGELSLSTFGDFGGGEGVPSDGIMHGLLKSPHGFTLMASDEPGGARASSGSAISISLSGDDAADLHAWWDKLSADGTVTMPLEKQVWGDEFGMCVDRFGVAWMVNIAVPQA